MELFIYGLIQVFLWIIIGGVFVIILALPIILALGALEFIAAATVNNVLMLIYRIPLLGPLFTGLVCSAVGIIMIILGGIVWVNYMFITIRCIAGGKF